MNNPNVSTVTKHWSRTSNRMCGIAGIFCYRQASRAPLDRQVGLSMVESLAHRGPDGGGLLVDGDRMLLGHRRLAILDLSERGQQPMTTEDERCWISFNGEIYNFVELRQELEALGHCFHSATDTEVILRGYRQWGFEVARRLNGIFAFAIWDRAAAKLWLVRDPVGVKPLFYRDDGSRLHFGSEIKAILADATVAREPDPSGIDAFLTFGYSPAPATGFRGIRQLLPGEWLVASDLGIELRSWFSLPYPAHAPRGPADDAVERLQDAVHRSVDRQMVSDVPLGAMLSGGLDSSAIVRAMTGSQHLDSNRLRPDRAAVETFTIRFQEAAFDESGYARQVAERYGTRHFAETVDADAATILPTLISHAEEPFADNSMIPFFLLSQFVRRRVTVALSGDGADELLGGYDTYRASQWAPYYRCLPGWARRTMAQAVRWLPPSQGKYALPNVLRRFTSAAEEPAPRDHCSWRRIVSRELRSELMSDAFQQQSREDPIGQYAGSASDAPEWLSPFERQLHVDLRFHLPNDMLTKVDRMSMAHGLEVRVPFLDLEVIRACLSLPPQWKRRGRKGKIVLRQWLSRDLPSALIDRRKSGFLVPLESWMRAAWQPLLRQHLTETWCSEISWIRWPVLRKMLDDQSAGREDHAYALFSLLVLAIWWRIWITQEFPGAQLKPAAKPTRIIERTAYRPH